MRDLGPYASTAVPDRIIGRRSADGSLFLDFHSCEAAYTKRRRHRGA